MYVYVYIFIYYIILKLLTLVVKTFLFRASTVSDINNLVSYKVGLFKKHHGYN